MEQSDPLRRSAHLPRGPADGRDVPDVRGGGVGEDMSLTEVSSILWRERELLELLLFKLEEEQLLLAAGRSRWLGHATREVEMVLDEIRRAELGRTLEVEEVAVSLGLSPAASLRELAEAAPPPWDDILREHRNAFLTASAEITSLAQTNRDLMTAGYRAARETLMSLVEPEPATYSPRGESVQRARGPRLLDEAI